MEISSKVSVTKERDFLHRPRFAPALQLTLPAVGDDSCEFRYVAEPPDAFPLRRKTNDLEWEINVGFASFSFVHLKTKTLFPRICLLIKNYTL